MLITAIVDIVSAEIESRGFAVGISAERASVRLLFV